MRRSCTCLAAILISLVATQPVESRGGTGDPPQGLPPPVEDGPFLRPVAGKAAEPTWGIKGGIAIGLWPNPGPRGLIRVYTPYLGQPRLKVMNFIAVEPVVGRVRGLSELEKSSIDLGVKGKAMWSVDVHEENPRSRDPWRPARGVVRTEDGHKVLAVFIVVEPFDNGARPAVEVRLRSDRPHEVCLRVFAAAGGKPMRSCILTATMGNYARLRRLYLKDRVEESRRVYDPFKPVIAGFAAHRQWGISEMLVRDRQALVAATPDEPDPASADYDADVAPNWHYRGVRATQYWRAPARPGLVVRVNGRRTYWASQAAIPGGVAYENFELEAPFEPGQEFCFGIAPGTPASLGFPLP